MHRRGGGGGGGGGAGGGADAQAARQLLLSIFDGALRGGGQGHRNGGAGGGGGNRRAFVARRREGEWECVCGFGTNRPQREFCFSCKRPREVAEVGCKGAARRGGAGSGQRQKGKLEGFASGGGLGKGGPVGAGGSRPLLGGRGREVPGGGGAKGTVHDAARAPAWNGKGPAYTATPHGVTGGVGAKGGPGGKAPARGGASEGVMADSTKGGTAGKAVWGRPTTVLDEEGYELVQPRRVRVTSGEDGAHTRATGRADDDNGCRRTFSPTQRRWTDFDSDDDDAEYAGADDGGEQGDVNGESKCEPDPSQLRAEFEEHARAVREMERAGGFGPALGTMRLARDEAEKRWRQAKAPAPLSKRLIWAEAKLEKAQAALTRTRLQLDQFDEDMARKRAELCDRMEEADRWYRWRQEQLEAIHAEAAGRTCGTSGCGAAGEGSTEVRQRIRGHMLPEMQAILEEIQEGSDLHGRLALVVAELADAETRLGTAQGDDRAARFDMWEGDSQDGDWGTQEQVQHGSAEADHQWEGSGNGQCSGRPAGWKPEGPGRWTRACNPGGGRQASRPSTEGLGGTQTSDGAPNVQREEGGRTFTGGSKGTAGEGTTSRGEGDHDDEAATRSAKHRRKQTDVEVEEEERKASDMQRALELHAQVERASAAQEKSYQEGTGGFGSEVALSMAAQSFVLDVQRAQAQASEMGIEPRSADGRTLLQLSPAELRQWVQQNLEDDGMRD